MKKSVGHVTIEERDRIQSIFDRRNGLIELSKIVTADNNDLYERMLADATETGIKFNQWWDEMSSKYHWESVENGRWEIDFENCEIYLTTPE